MLNFKKTEVTLIILLIIFVSGFFILQNPSFIAKLFLIDSRATQQSVALSITIGGGAEETIIVSSSGEVIPTESTNLAIIYNVTGLPPGSSLKLTVFTSDLPSGFTAPSASSVSQVFNYVNLTLNTTLTGTAKIYFNISQSKIGSIDIEDIKLFHYTTEWEELETTVINGASDPAQFYAITTSLSRFLIGEKAAGLPSITMPLAAGGSISKGGKEVEIPEPTLKPVKSVIKIPEIIKKVVEKIIELPKELIKYKISYKIIYIVAASLIILVILLEVIYFIISKRR